MVFSTKAGTLALLQGRLRSARIAPLAFFTVAEWRVDPRACLAHVLASIGNGPMIVRSSCQIEDGAKESNAGAFLSLLNVKADGLDRAVEEVIAAYLDNSPNDEVLIQPMLRQVVRSGVAFSHDPNTCAPYRVVNWLEGGDTTAVTGGKSGRTWQQAGRSSLTPPAELAGVRALFVFPTQAGSR